MSRNIVHEGGPDDVLPYTNVTGAAIASGAVIKMANTIGIALVAIPIAAVGSVAIGGVISGMTKTTGNAWLQGQKLVWDVSVPAWDTEAVTEATGDVTGAAIAWLAAASGDTTGTIKLTPGNTTIT